MFYRTDVGNFTVISRSNISESLPLPSGQIIAAKRNVTGKIAIAVWGEASKGQIIVYDIQKKKMIWNIEGMFYDLSWFDEQSLLFSTGTTIKLISERGLAEVDLCKYSRIPYGPIDFRLSPGRSVIGFLSWQGDNRKPTFSIVDSKIVFKSKHSCFSMNFQNEKEALFDYGGSIYHLDIQSDSKTLLLKSTRKLVEREKTKTSQELERIRSVMENPTLIIDHLAHPILINGRIYFSSFICSEKRKCVSLLSVDTKLSDLKVHLQFDQGIVRSIHVADGGAFFAMLLEPNSLQSETMEPGWYFLTEGKRGFIENARLLGH